jgi:maleylacetoacetate isomerase
MNPKLTLYSYWRSSASWRVRWALELKGLAYECKTVNLLKVENREKSYLEKNPAGLLPLLEVDGQKRVGQSMAILSFLEALAPKPELFGKDAWEKAKIFEFCETINADTAPLQTPRAQKRHSADEAERKAWAQEFIRAGLGVCEKLATLSVGSFVFGNQPSAADLFLIPQVYNAKRYEIPVDAEFPRLAAIYEHAMGTLACKKAAPDAQSDAQKS